MKHDQGEVRRVSLPQLTREGDEDTIRRLLFAGNREKIDKLDENKVRSLDSAEACV